MSGKIETVDVAGGMVAAACAPAVVGTLIALILGGPLVAFFLFGAAMIVAAGHVVLLALPSYVLLKEFGWRPGWATALVAAIIIGAVPASFLLGLDAAPYGCAFGLIGGLAFCAMSFVRVSGTET